MAPRLLSLLSFIQASLVEHGATVASLPVQRSVSYHKGLARLTFADGGTIALQNFSLADGQICVKAALFWAGREEPVIHAIYPHGDSHDWKASADSVALAWTAGPESALQMPPRGSAAEAVDRLVAVV